MIEKLHEWEPIDGLSEKYVTESISRDFENGLVIMLSDKNNSTKCVKITFKYSPEVFKVAKVECLHAYIKNYNEKYQNICNKWTFFVITESLYLKWLSDESHRLSDHLGPFYHFCFITDNSIIDIIDDQQPHVELIEIK